MNSEDHPKQLSPGDWSSGKDHNKKLRDLEKKCREPSNGSDTIVSENNIIRSIIHWRQQFMFPTIHVWKPFSFSSAKAHHVRSDFILSKCRKYFLCFTAKSYVCGSVG
ncbi:hypothetical protein PoB_001619400 [Plakobranchus ocellatus]|uniref:Uncharacterized protein n=1 Tax=Plakobranchus ocellatus TaxID=259542 RepID=A0AAV3Z5M0_9GAST|nr:hypothetical protein PoB_001619400 [Plakobranchus ocellatus]